MLEELFKKYNIEIIDNWQVKRNIKGMPSICDYYMFNHKGLDYCISFDSISYVFSDEKGRFIYMGFSVKELEKELKKVVKK